MPLLDLAYSPDVPRALLREMERAGRRMGLALATMERLGQEPALCEAFVRAARVGDRVRLRALAGSAAAAVAVPPPAPLRLPPAEAPAAEPRPAALPAP